MFEAFKKQNEERKSRERGQEVNMRPHMNSLMTQKV